MDVKYRRRLLPRCGYLEEAFYWQGVTWICTLVAFILAGLWGTRLPWLTKGPAQSSLESIKISYGNATASLLVSSVCQCNCGHCCFDTRWSCVLKLWGTPSGLLVSRHPWPQPATQTTPRRSHVWGSTSALLRLPIMQLSCSCYKWASPLLSASCQSGLAAALVSPSPQLPDRTRSCISQYILQETLFGSLPHSEPVNHPTSSHPLSSSLRDAV